MVNLSIPGMPKPRRRWRRRQVVILSVLGGAIGLNLAMLVVIMLMQGAGDATNGTRSASNFDRAAGDVDGQDAASLMIDGGNMQSPFNVESAYPPGKTRLSHDDLSEDRSEIEAHGRNPKKYKRIVSWAEEIARTSELEAEAVPGDPASVRDRNSSGRSDGAGQADPQQLAALNPRAGEDLAVDEPDSSASERVIYEEALPVDNHEADSAVLNGRSSPWETAPRGQALISIIIDDVGPSWRNSLSAIDLPYPITMAFLPYTEQIDMLVERARSRYHEVMLHLPMEPIGNENPGPNALLSDSDPHEFERRLQWSLDQLDNYAGVNNHMGSKLTTETEPMAHVMAAIRERGVFFVDSKTTSHSIAGKIAASAGLPSATRDVFLDNVVDVEAIIAQLDLTAAIARRRGSAIAIGHPHPQTIQALEQWLPEAARRGLIIAPVAELIKFRDCLEAGSAGCINLVAVR